MAFFLLAASPYVCTIGSLGLLGFASDRTERGLAYVCLAMSVPAAAIMTALLVAMALAN